MEQQNSVHPQEVEHTNLESDEANQNMAHDVTLSENLDDENIVGESLEDMNNPETTNSSKSPENNDLQVEVTNTQIP